MKPKKIVAIAVLLVFIFSLSAFGCGKKGAKKPGGKGGGQQKTVIGVSLADTKEEPGKSIKKGMQQNAKNEKDIELKFSDAGKDSTKQEEEVDKLIEQKPKVIVLQVVDPDLGKDLVRRIMQKKIKVIAIDKLPKDVAVDGYIAPDYSRAGELAGEFTAKQIVGKPAGLMLLQGEKTDTQTQDVTAGLTKILGGLPIQTTPVPRSEPQTATTVVQQKLTSGGVGTIIATNSLLATAAADAVKLQNKSGQVTVVGIGGSSKAAQAIKSGDLTAEVDTQPLLVGQTAFKAAKDLAKTQHWEFERNIKNDTSDIPAKLIPVRLVTKENVFLLETSGGGGGSSSDSSGGSDKKDKKKKKQGDSSGSDSGGDSGGSSGGGSEGSKGGGQKGMTKVKITTEDGKTMEFTIKGKVKKIESQEGGAGGGGGQSGGGSEGGGGGGESGGGGGS